MKKEKQVRSYKRRTKSGKIITVKAHTAKYEAADEKAKKSSKKEGAGKELEERKKKPVQLEIPFDKEEEKKVLEEVKETAKSEKPTAKKTTKKVRPVGGGTVGPEPKKKKSSTGSTNDDQAVTPADKDSLSKARKGGYMPTKGKSLESGVSTTKKTTKTTPKSTTSEPAFTAAEFKEWYRGTGSAADKKVAKALRAQLGRSGYRKFEDEAIDNYTSHGHLSMFKRVVGSGGQSSSDSKKSATRVASKSMDSKKVANKDNWRKTSDTPLRKKGDMAVGSMNVGKRSIDLEVRPTDKGYEVSMYDRKGNIGHLGNIHIKTLSDLSKQVKSEVAPKRKLTSKLMDSGEIDYDTVRIKSKKLKSQEV